MSFVFVTCQAGAEPALKRELARVRPELRAAFSRPGFVTFKWNGDGFPGNALVLDSVLSRAYGECLGRIGGPSEDRPALARLVAEKGALAAQAGARPRLHVFERTPHLPGDEPPGYVVGEESTRARAAILAAAGTSFEEDETAAPGDLVLDVIVVERDPAEWWLGMHRHSGDRIPLSGAMLPAALPAEAPSRAYLKLEEMIAWSGARLLEGDSAIDVGCAPGGATYSLLERGLDVCGIDTGRMDAAILAFGSRFSWARRGVDMVTRDELPRSPQWLLIDMNVPPTVSLKASERLVDWYRGSLLGAIFTLKLNHARMADEIPGWLERVRKMGFRTVRAAQLASHRREIGVVALASGADRRK
jgi:23S rRNA (cytidine2498-2'-O)-methyltransferase